MNKALYCTVLVALVGLLGFIKPQALEAQLADASATLSDQAKRFRQDSSCEHELFVDSGHP